MDDKSRYLGDGIYASFDGLHIILEFTGESPRHKFIMDLSPETLRTLDEYRKEIDKRMQEHLAQMEQNNE